MKLDKIVKNINGLLSKKKKKDPEKQIGALRNLVGKLERKEAKVAKRLHAADSRKEKEKLTLKLKTCRAQLEKGRAALADLNG